MKYSRSTAAFALAQLLALGLAVPAVHAAQNEPAAAGVPAAARGERKVKLDFVQADINDVAKALSIQSGVNVVLMPSVKGSVTVRLVDLGLEEALKKVAAAVGSDVRKMEETYFLGSTIELKTMVARSGVKETLVPKHIPAQEAKEVLTAAFPYLTVDAPGKANILIVSGTREDVSAAAKMLVEADVAPPVAPKPEPPKPEMVKDTYQIKSAKAEMLVDTLHRSVPNLKVVNVEKTLVLEGTKEEQTFAAKLLGALDVQQQDTSRVVRSYSVKYLNPVQAQATLKGLFPELQVQPGFESHSPDRATFRPPSIDTEKAFSATGLQGGAAGGAGAAGGGGGGGAAASANGGAGGGAAAPGSVAAGTRARTLILIGPREQVEQATQILLAEDIAPKQVIIEARVVDIFPQKTEKLGFLYEWSSLGFSENTSRGRRPYQFGGWTRLPFDWQVTVEAMEENRQAKTLARPNISVIDGEEASVFIGDILRYERLASQDQGVLTFTIETVPVGVALLCRPKIVEETGEILLRVHPVVSAVTDFTGRNRDIPVTTSREAETIIRLKDGETFAIGGLLREEELKILTKVPILGNLPFFGQLFRHRNNSFKKSEVTIFITAKIQDNP